jgi:hypothetical protein
VAQHALQRRLCSVLGSSLPILKRPEPTLLALWESRDRARGHGASALVWPVRALQFPPEAGIPIPFGSRFGRESPPFPDSESAGIGKHTESPSAGVSRLGRERESGSRLAANREIGGLLVPVGTSTQHDPPGARRVTSRM